MLLSLLLAPLAHAGGLTAPKAGSVSTATPTVCYPASNCLNIEASGPNGEVPPWLLRLLGLSTRTDIGLTISEVTVDDLTAKVDLLYVINSSGQPDATAGLWLVVTTDIDRDGYDDILAGSAAWSTSRGLSANLEIYRGDSSGVSGTDSGLSLYLYATQQAWGSSGAPGFVWEVTALQVTDASGVTLYSTSNAPVEVSLGWSGFLYEDTFTVGRSSTTTAETLDFANASSTGTLTTSATLSSTSSSSSDRFDATYGSSTATTSTFTGSGTTSTYSLRDADAATTRGRTVSTVVSERGDATRATITTTSLIGSVSRTTTVSPAPTSLAFAAFPGDSSTTMWADVATAVARGHR